MAQSWLRLYRAAVNNPKVQRLGLEAVGFWMNCLCLSDDEGRLPKTPELAWSMRVTETVAETFLKLLHETGLIDRDGVSYVLHDWHEHQFRSDTSTERVRRFRQKRHETKRNVSETSPDTDTDTDTDTEQKQKEQSARKPRAGANGTRWPADAVVSEEWITEGAAYRELSNMPPVDLRLEAERFQNYWSSKAGAGATKVDWKRTWLNWVINVKGAANGSGKGQSGGLGPAGTVFLDNYLRARADREGSGG